MRYRVLAATVVLLLVTSARSAPVVIGQPTPQARRVSALASLLDQDMAAFGQFANFAGVGNAPLDAMTLAGNRNIDLVMYDLEHSPFDVTALQTYMQFLLDPGAIAGAADVKASKTVIARIPAYGRELDKNTWMVKNILDVGVHGVVFPPHRDTGASVDGRPRDAISAVAQRAGLRAGRHPRLRGDGGRAILGDCRCLTTWPSQTSGGWIPQGNLMPWFIIENKLGVANVLEIARQLSARNIGAVLWAGTGDLGASYNNNQESVAIAVDVILAAGKEYGLPVAMNGSANVRQRMDQGARIFMGGATAAAREAAGR